MVWYIIFSQLWLTESHCTARFAYTQQFEASFPHANLALSPPFFWYYERRMMPSTPVVYSYITIDPLEEIWRHEPARPSRFGPISALINMTKRPPIYPSTLRYLYQ
jgi:hypothetical protein